MLTITNYAFNFFIFIFVTNDFMYLQDKATLEDSLELFVAEELFSGDNKLEDPDAGMPFAVQCIAVTVTVLSCNVLNCVVL